MKKTLTLILSLACILFGSISTDIYAANDNTPPKPASSKPDTQQSWIVQITPRLAQKSYESKISIAPALKGPAIKSTNNKAASSVIISPRVIPNVSQKQKHSLTQRTIRQIRNLAYRNSFPWMFSYTYGNRYSTPAFDMYSDLVRSNWYGSPYHGHYFYNQGYRPSFRFGSLQFRGFGNYDRMYNPRIIPFGYQYAGSRTYYAALAMTAMYPTYRW